MTDLVPLLEYKDRVSAQKNQLWLNPDESGAIVEIKCRFGNCNKNEMDGKLDSTIQ